MQTLAQIRREGRCIVSKVNGSRNLTRRLTELGMVRGKVVTVIATADSNSGLLIYFQGQRLAVSPEMAECIEVMDLGSLDDSELVSLDSIPLKKSGVVVRLNGSKALRRRLMDMGLTRNTIVTVQQVAPLGDPLELTLRGYKLSLRRSEAANIMVKEASL